MIITKEQKIAAFKFALEKLKSHKSSKTLHICVLVGQYIFEETKEKAILDLNFPYNTQLVELCRKRTVSNHVNGVWFRNNEERILALEMTIRELENE